MMRPRFVRADLLRTAAAFVFLTAPSPAQLRPDAYYQDLLRKHASRFSECLQPDMQGSAHAVNVALVLDASGPTKAQMTGGVTLDVLRASALKFAKLLPGNVNIAFVVYGHRGNMTLVSQEESCKGVDVAVPAGPYRPALTATLEQLKPGGWTPLQGAIRKAADSFAGVSDLFTDNLIFLLAAGMDTCGGRPRETVRTALAAHPRTKINVLSPSSSAAEQEELRAVAKLGGGDFVPVSGPNDLSRYFEKQARTIRDTYKQNRVSVACFETRLTTERAAIQHDLMLDSTGSAPTIDAGMVKYVNDRLQQRQSKIRALAARPELTPEMIDKELRAIE